jgi:glyoxylase-like metal-dependent hydrolase (beta-lactamase superfamily II)
MTLAGTNTYVVGREPAYVIDPGPADAAHLDSIRAQAASRGGIGGVLLTHGHSDHTEGVEELGEPVLWGEAGRSSEAEAMMAALGGSAGALHGLAPAEGRVPDPGVTEVAGFTIVPTPGHATDHVCFVRERICFCGDLILGEGSTIVPPAAGGGSLADYMASLRRVAELDVDVLAPGHGPLINDPAARIAEYVEHRESREHRLLAALDAGERSRAALLATVWDDVPEQLRPAAAIAMQAHLEKLAAEGSLAAAELTD